MLLSVFLLVLLNTFWKWKLNCCLNPSLSFLSSFLNNMSFTTRSSFPQTARPWAPCSCLAIGPGQAAVWPVSMQALGAWAPRSLYPSQPACGVAGVQGPSCRDDQGFGGHRQCPEQDKDYTAPEWLFYLLISYLKRVISLEADNQRLESKIQEHLEERIPGQRLGALF